MLQVDALPRGWAGCPGAAAPRVLPKTHLIVSMLHACWGVGLGHTPAHCWWPEAAVDRPWCRNRCQRRLVMSIHFFPTDLLLQERRLHCLWLQKDSATTYKTKGMQMTPAVLSALAAGTAGHKVMCFWSGRRNKINPSSSCSHTYAPTPRQLLPLPASVIGLDTRAPPSPRSADGQDGLAP